MKRVKRALIGTSTIIVVLIGVCGILGRQAYAQTDHGFSLQVSPSPLIATVKPGSDTTLELRIRNTNTSSQALKMGIKSFSVDDTTGQVKLGEDNPTEVRDLVHFENPTFTLKAGEIFTERIHFTVSPNAGFSYNFAITIAQQNAPKATKGSTSIAGSVAVFTLVNVDRLGATRQLKLSSLSASKHTYEYLPASISVRLKNTGNTNVQPTGTIFIQRHSSDTTPLATLPLNKGGGYIVPDTSRTFTSEWDDGFPHYQTTQEHGLSKQKLVWQGGLSKLRIGRYNAKIVAVYNDGQRDIPVMAEVSFWVIPWRLILGILFLTVILIIGLVVVARTFGKAFGATSRRVRRASNLPRDKNHA